MKTKNIVASVPYEVYIQLDYIAKRMQVPLPDLMGQILNNEFFINAVQEMFQMVAQVPEKK